MPIVLFAEAYVVPFSEVVGMPLAFSDVAIKLVVSKEVLNCGSQHCQPWLKDVVIGTIGRIVRLLCLAGEGKSSMCICMPLGRKAVHLLPSRLFFGSPYLEELRDRAGMEEFGSAIGDLGIAVEGRDVTQNGRSDPSCNLYHKVETKKCAICENVKYCSRKCQRQDCKEQVCRSGKRGEG